MFDWGPNQKIYPQIIGKILWAKFCWWNFVGDYQMKFTCTTSRILCIWRTLSAFVSGEMNVLEQTFSATRSIEFEIIFKISCRLASVKYRFENSFFEILMEYPYRPSPRWETTLDYEDAWWTDFWWKDVLIDEGLEFLIIRVCQSVFSIFDQCILPLGNHLSTILV